MTTPTSAEPSQDQSTAALDKKDSSATTEGNTASQLLYNLVAQQPFFKGLNPHQLQLLADCAMEIQFETGQSILQEGSPANRFYLILEGKVMLESELPDHELVPLQTLGPGDDLGWSWLFPPYLMTSSARALEPTRTIFFYGTRLREHCEHDPDFGYQLMQRITAVVIQRLQATQKQLMECIGASKLSST